MANFCTWILWKLIKAGNRESFFGNEGKDVRQQNFFTLNQEYIIPYIMYSCLNDYQYMALTKMNSITTEVLPTQSKYVALRKIKILVMKHS